MASDAFAVLMFSVDGRLSNTMCWLARDRPLIWFCCSNDNLGRCSVKQCHALAGTYDRPLNGFAPVIMLSVSANNAMHCLPHRIVLKGQCDAAKILFPPIPMLCHNSNSFDVRIWFTLWKDNFLEKRAAIQCFTVSRSSNLVYVAEKTIDYPEEKRRGNDQCLKKRRDDVSLWKAPWKNSL